MAVFEDEFIVNCPVQKVFDFLLRPANIVRVADPSVGLKFIDPPEVVQQGTRLSFQILAMGQVQKAEHEITLVTPPSLIVEELRKGVMKKWRHEHIFEDQAGSTRIIDRIEFEPPGGILGFLVTESKILEALEDSHFQRQQLLKKFLETESHG
jgi:ligand-binding SRPBCC domain-containing protein